MYSVSFSSSEVIFDSDSTLIISQSDNKIITVFFEAQIIQADTVYSTFIEFQCISRSCACNNHIKLSISVISIIVYPDSVIACAAKLNSILTFSGSTVYTDEVMTCSNYGIITIFSINFSACNGSNFVITTITCEHIIFISTDNCVIAGT